MYGKEGCPTLSVGQLTRLLGAWLPGIGALLAPRTIFVASTRLSPSLTRDVRYSATGASVCHGYHLLQWSLATLNCQ